MTDPDEAMRMIRKDQRDLLKASEDQPEQVTPLPIQAVRIADLKMKLATLMEAMRHPA